MSNNAIFEDNLLYLNAWMAQNENLKTNLQVVGTDLVWSCYGKTKRVSLEDFYLPMLLYNYHFREDIMNPEVFTGEDLFRIIQVHVIAQSIEN